MEKNSLESCDAHMDQIKLLYTNRTADGTEKKKKKKPVKSFFKLQIKN